MFLKSELYSALVCDITCMANVDVTSGNTASLKCQLMRNQNISDDDLWQNQLGVKKKRQVSPDIPEHTLYISCFTSHRLAN